MISSVSTPETASGKRIEKVVVVSDTHILSTVGLWPDQYTTIEGQTIFGSKAQNWLWETWKEAWDWVKKEVGDSYWALVWNGDCIDGRHHNTTQSMTPNPDDQFGVFLDIRKVCGNPHKEYFVSGTECHTHGYEHAFGKELGAVKCPDTERYSWDKLRLAVNDYNVVFRHHMPTAKRKYLEWNAYGAELANEQLEAIQNKWVVPNGLCVAHRHVPGYADKANQFVLVTGPWQYLTRYGHKVVPHASCHPSIAILDWEGKKEGEMPYVKRMEWTELAQHIEIL